MKRKAADDTPRHTVILDWDGCLVPSAWPDQPLYFMPGAVDAVRKFHHAGFKLMVFTARMNPYDPWTGQKLDPSKPAREKAYIRDMLDRHGLTYVDIWDKMGKPSGSAYVDDKAVPYGGTSRSWAATTNRVLIMLGSSEPLFPAIHTEHLDA